MYWISSPCCASVLHDSECRCPLSPPQSDTGDSGDWLVMATRAWYTTIASFNCVARDHLDCSLHTFIIVFFAFRVAKQPSKCAIAYSFFMPKSADKCRRKFRLRSTLNATNASIFFTDQLMTFFLSICLSNTFRSIYSVKWIASFIMGLTSITSILKID